MFKFGIDNYRAFKDQCFDFSSVNILIGENSSGKSSIIKFFLALKQSLEGLESGDMNLSLSGDYVDLGNYNEVVYNHMEDLNIEFYFEFDDYFRYFSNYLTNTLASNKTATEKDGDIAGTVKSFILKNLQGAEIGLSRISIELTKNLNEHKSIKTLISNTCVGSIEISFPEGNGVSDDYIIGNYTFCNLKFLSFDNDNSIFEIDNIRYTKKAFLSLLASSSLREQINKKELDENESDKLFWRVAFLALVQNYLEDLLLKIEFVNPMHSQPERFYYEKDKKKVYKKNSIEKMIAFLGEKSYKAILDHMSEIMSDYGIAEGIEINKDAKLPVKEMKAKVQGLWSNITDVGYGVSLQLPIIFEALLGEFGQKKGKILIIEQPEVHLHPRLQAKFIETLLKLTKNNIYIIETHSEYIIRKLQVIVKDKTFGIKSTDISINYLRRMDYSVCSVHKIDEKGKLIPKLPESFFDNSYELAKELLD